MSSLSVSASFTSWALVKTLCLLSSSWRVLSSKSTVGGSVTPGPTTFLTICLRTELPGLLEVSSGLKMATK